MKAKTKSIRLPRVARPERNFVVEEGQSEAGLLAYLVQYALREKSRTSVKQILSDRYISVNGEPTTQWDYPLQAGDRVTLHPSPLPTTLSHKYVDILWQDEHLILIHKAAGIPTVSSGEERDETAMQVLSWHLKKFNPKAKVYLLNRIDKDSSGFVLMAKTSALQSEMSDNWNKYVPTQHFALVIHGSMPERSGYLAAPIAEGKDESKPRERQQGASTAGEARYRCLSQTDIGTLLSVELLSGRNNRLRKQFAQIKRPIIGDWRNGSSRKDLGYVALDMTVFAFVHPLTGKQYKFEQPIPGKFRRLLKP